MGTALRRADEIQITKRLLAHIQNGTAESAPRQHEVSVKRYIDPDVWAHEVETFFKRLPIVAGMSCELPGPGTYVARDIVGVPVLLVRDAEGGVNAFLNVCRHRGAVVAQGCGRATRFTCPYHAWTYDQSGRLVGVASEETFGAVERKTHGLTRLNCAERAGLIFVGLTPGMPFDIDAYLAGIDQLIEPKELYLGGERRIEAPNWKIVMDGHLESYHFASLHKNTVGPTTINNCATIDRFGPHIRITIAGKTILDLLQRPESEWRPLQDGMITTQYVFFPGTCVTFAGNARITHMIRPEQDALHSSNTMVTGFDEPAEDEATSAAQAFLIDGTRAVLAEEDYAVGFGIQKGIQSGAQSDFIYGLNEPGVIYFHETTGDIAGGKASW
jgi:phenylpropionate dioxygenase-like ring-hydroxylating dioxygenase large terminal subunit